VGVSAEPTYRIAGGAAPYMVTSSNVAVATVTQTTNTFSVKGVAVGQAVVSIRDANGTAVNIITEVR
jgi:phage tail tape-measure protein